MTDKYPIGIVSRDSLFLHDFARKHDIRIPYLESLMDELRNDVNGLVISFGNAPLNPVVRDCPTEGEALVLIEAIRKEKEALYQDYRHGRGLWAPVS